MQLKEQDVNGGGLLPLFLFLILLLLGTSFVIGHEGDKERIYWDKVEVEEVYRVLLV